MTNKPKQSKEQALHEKRLEEARRALAEFKARLPWVISRMGPLPDK